MPLSFNEKMDIPEKYLSKLICSVCKDYLTFPPVKFDNGNYICGRCPSPGIEITPYNILLELFKFPCCYNKYGCRKICEVSNSLNGINIHEQQCLFVPYKCPNENCTFKTSVYNFINHIQTDHPENILKNGFFSCDATRNIAVVKYLISHSTIFAVFINTVLSSSEMNITLQNIGSNYEINFKFNVTITFSTKKILLEEGIINHVDTESTNLQTGFLQKFAVGESKIDLEIKITN